jgi:FixJ family two-component response regulator
MMTSPAPLVFIVDDDASVRKALGRLVRAAGYEVELFGCASEFLAREVSIRPACLLLDVRMPGMSGIELQQTLGGTQRDLPIVFITGHGDEAVRERTLAAGAVDVLYKPVDDRVLLAAIEQALSRSQRQ